MPTYEYLCQACGTRFEVWQKMSDDALTACQACGGPVRRVLYPAGIVFKGGGFYSTDHRSNGATAANGAHANGAHAAEGAAEGAKDSATTTDAKSATTPPATPATPAGGSGSSGTASGGTSSAGSSGN